MTYYICRMVLSSRMIKYQHHEDPDDDDDDDGGVSHLCYEMIIRVRYGAHQGFSMRMKMTIIMNIHVDHADNGERSRRGSEPRHWSAIDCGGVVSYVCVCVSDVSVLAALNTKALPRMTLFDRYGIKTIFQIQCFVSNENKNYSVSRGGWAVAFLTFMDIVVSMRQHHDGMFVLWCSSYRTIDTIVSVVWLYPSMVIQGGE